MYNLFNTCLDKISLENIAKKCMHANNIRILRVRGEAKRSIVSIMQVAAQRRKTFPPPRTK